MSKLQEKIGRLVQKVIDGVSGNGLMQEETSASGERYVTPGMPELLRKAGAESCVLLKNDGTLPLKQGEEVAVFGRCQLDWFYVGYGSGGDVSAPYHVNLVDGLHHAGVAMNPALLDTYHAWTKENQVDHGWWGHWPMHYEEMPVTKEMAQKAAKTSKTALVVIGRAAGEDRENTLTKGSYYLTDEETQLLDTVTSSFAHVAVLLNIGSIMDMAWTKNYGDKLSALMIVWQGGMESGNSVADVLTGKVNPSGRLGDTIANAYEDYPSAKNFGGLEFNEYEEGIYVGYRYFDKHPEKVLYPFGFGLSYTSFEILPGSLSREEGVTRALVTVINTGEKAGKEAVLLWAYLPQGRLDKPVRVLAGFAKTKELLPGEKETLTITAEDKNLSSYEEETHRFILEAGEYGFKANETTLNGFTLEEEVLVEQCHAICLPSDQLKTRILENLPKAVAPYGSHPVTFEDVAAGKNTLEDLIAQLSDEDLEALSRGHGMMGSVLGTVGNAGAFGGVTKSLQEKKIPPLVTADGPAGLRLKKFCALLPCGTGLACTFNTELVEALYQKVGEEMVHYNIDVQLAPGMNIHRNPLCGRNFEYFSEDPLLSGKMGAAVVKGEQSMGKSSCPKHFACNNQETKRNTNDSRVSERAMREIYLRNFEIVVKEAKPRTIMTSYNKVNGVWSHYNYDLVTTVLREEWGFDGCVITDWWMQKSKSPEFPDLRDNAYRVRAQVDVLMPGNWGHFGKKRKKDGTLLETLGKPEGITRGELQRTAKNVLTLALRVKEQGQPKTSR